MVPPMPSVADAGRRPPTHWTLAETLAHECRTNHIPRRATPALPPGRHLDGTQLFPTRLLFLGATLRINDLDQLCLERLQPLAHGNIGGIVDDPRACAGRETNERRIEMSLQIP